MATLKLAKLPDATPVKLHIQIMPSLNRALTEYAALYAEVYGSRASVADLIPAMLANFLESDRDFARLRKQNGDARL